jgi:hypothetical protein
VRILRFRLFPALVLAVAVLAPAASTGIAFREAPPKLSDAEFWKLSQDLSEPNGYFRSDNLLSNEIGFQTIIPELKTIVKPGVYLGVGPEQNFTYIASLRPKMAFISDIRRGNLHLHLMYKALFEMATDRADFVGMLFGKTRPEGLTAASSVNEIFTKYDAERTNAEVHDATWKRMVGVLTKAPHTLPLDQGDIEGLQYVVDSFYNFGTAINYNSSASGGFGRGGSMATYEILMTANDGRGQQISYLANEELFGYMKTLESRNLLVPVVGDFAGTTALRAIGAYIRAHDETVQAFYLSNVEDYLTGDLWQRFCNNVSTLPLTDASTFIYGARPQGGGGRGGGLASWYRPILPDVKQYNCKGL